MSSVWTIMLGLSAGYLINKNLTYKTMQLQKAQKEFNSAAAPSAEAPMTEQIRDVQRAVPASVVNESMNVADLTRKDLKLLQSARDAAAQQVVQYESPQVPVIEGVYLDYSR